MKLFVWTDRFSYLAVAHAKSTLAARQMLVPEIGGWDESSPERTKARKQVVEHGPEIWMGPVCEFAITDSEAVRQLEAENEKLKEEIARLKSEAAR